MTGRSVECCFGMMYVEWYGVCNYFSVVEICVFMVLGFVFMSVE